MQVILVICMGLGVAWFWVACAPQERHQVLTFFFDGVPDPNAPPKPKPVHGRTAAAAAAAAQRTTAVIGIISHHKPYVNNQCASCHPSNWGANNGEFAIPIAELCIKCHAKIPNQYPRMHGPVAVKACDRCHDPHEAGEPHLLKTTPRKLCVQCHEPNMLSSFPIQHIDGTTSCLDCHNAHGGPKRYFLHAPPVTTQPATQPASQPAVTQPATPTPPTTPEAAPPPARRPDTKELL